jgi:hypothetical protein
MRATPTIIACATMMQALIAAASLPGHDRR